MGRHYVPVTGGNNGDFFVMLDVTDPSRIAEGRGGGDPPKFDVLELGQYRCQDDRDKRHPVRAGHRTANDNGLQIINMSDPSSPISVAAVTDGHGGFNTLDDAWRVDAAKIGDEYYALVTTDSDDNAASR